MFHTLFVASNKVWNDITLRITKHTVAWFVATFRVFKWKKRFLDSSCCTFTQFLFTSISYSSLNAFGEKVPGFKMMYFYVVFILLKFVYTSLIWQVVVLIGSSASAVDISRDIATVAKEVRIAARSHTDGTFRKLPGFKNLYLHSMVQLSNTRLAIIGKSLQGDHLTLDVTRSVAYKWWC